VRLVQPIGPNTIRCLEDEGQPEIAPELLRQRTVFDSEVNSRFECRVERSDAVRSEDQNALEVLEQAKEY